MKAILILIFSMLLIPVTEAKGQSNLLGDGALEHCSVLIGHLSGLPMWRDTNIPLSRVQNTLDHIITEDPPEGAPMTQSELDDFNRHEKHKVTMAEWNAMVESEKSGLTAWHSSVASTPQDMADWNNRLALVIGGPRSEYMHQYYCDWPCAMLNVS